MLKYVNFAFSSISRVSTILMAYYLADSHSFAMAFRRHTPSYADGILHTGRLRGVARARIEVLKIMIAWNSKYTIQPALMTLMLTIYYFDGTRRLIDDGA